MHFLRSVSVPHLAPYALSSTRTCFRSHLLHPHPSRAGFRVCVWIKGENSRVAANNGSYPAILPS